MYHVVVFVRRNSSSDSSSGPKNDGGNSHGDLEKEPGYQKMSSNEQYPQVRHVVVVMLTFSD